MSKEIKTLVKELKDNGWSVEKTKKHYKARHPKTNKLLTFSATPSCPFCIKHIRGDIKRFEKGVY